MAEPDSITSKTAPYQTFSPGVAGGDLISRPLQYIKGVGPAHAKLLQRLSLETLQDLLFFFPIGHKDRESVTPIRQVKAGHDVNLVARIIDVRGKRMNGKERIEALLQDETGEIKAGWWNPWIADKLKPHAWAFFSGKVVLFAERRELSSPEFEILQYDDSEALSPLERSMSGQKETPSIAISTGPSFGRIVPFYNLRPKQRLPNGQEAPEIRMTQNFIRKVVWQSLEAGAAEQLADQLPAELCKQLNLMRLPQAIREYHFPSNEKSKIQARRRLVFEELFVLSLGVALRRAQVTRLEPPKKMPLAPAIHTRILARLPFQLTPCQAKAFKEIATDMASPHPMNRLLQGDVGSGKTAVAVASLLLCVAHGSQAVLLAPTEVLAEQHTRTLEKMLANSRVKIGLLRGGAKTSARKEFLAQLAAGEIHIAVGTHALLEDDVKFQSMGLAVVDEQHKFGVAQRMSLRAKGRAPHVLVMTATPIPRTLTLTLYGDLDISRIDQAPAGRGEIVSKWLKEVDRPRVYKLIVDEARKGHATYIVLPRIEDDGLLKNPPAPPAPAAAEPGKKPRIAKKLWSEVKGAEEELKRMRAHLPTLRIDMLHGRMSGEDKDRVLTLLREGRIDVLVSTQVIEVGIDLPTATTMLIENAELFGLAALHQLRGRVGRSERKSYCLIFGEPSTEESKERLKTFVSTRDGFKIAEADFKLRGPGQFFGTEQSGMPELKVADLLSDQDTLIEAREKAFKLVASDPRLAAPEHAGLKQRVKEVLGQRLGLVDVG